jgi:hypothetical protein
MRVLCTSEEGMGNCPDPVVIGDIYIVIGEEEQRNPNRPYRGRFFQLEGKRYSYWEQLFSPLGYDIDETELVNERELINQ